MFIDKKTLRVLKTADTLANVLIFFFRPLRAVFRFIKSDFFIDLMFAMFLSGLLVILLAM